MGRNSGIGWFLVGSLLLPMGASACGGFFCNAQTQVPIVQAGERVVFARSGDTTIMHVEVRYAGAPTDFGWLVPVPIRVPAEGQPAPVLEEILALSHPDLFASLDQATRPTFTVTQTGGCAQPLSEARSSGGCGSQEVSASSASNGRSADADFREPVTTLAEADIGPYAAELIHATNTGALFVWLGENGYLQDENARPLLDYYVKLNYSFIGLRLQAGQDVADLRPVVLTLDELAPCVPLRLTSIAATTNMPIQIFVLGESRAVPKNFLSATVNLHALSWPGAANYTDMVTDAVDSAAGHAFVTEFAGPLAGLVVPTRDLVDLRDRVTTAESVSAITTFLFADTTYQALVAEGLELEPFRARVLTEIIEPLERQEALLASAKWVTRFFTTTDPDEMTRDPIFAFNATLPAVRKDHDAAVESTCEGTVFITYPDGTRRESTPVCDVFGCRVEPTSTAVPLCEAELLDETGAPVSIHPGDTIAADALLELATPGQPSIPAGQKFRTGTRCVGHPEAIATTSRARSSALTATESWDGDVGGCATLPEPSRAPIWMSALGALALWMVRRRLADRR